MRLDCQWLLRLGKNFEQVSIRQKVKSGKPFSFLLQITSELFLDSFKIFVRLLESFKEAVLAAHFKDQNTFACLVHCMSPCRINGLKLFIFLNELFGDICGIKNRLQIHPLTLTLSPFLQHVRHYF